METIVTRGSQITLTKEIREKLHIKEGDRLVLNIQGDVLMVSKKDARIFDKIESFLPDKFEYILKKIRFDARDRLKRLGITQ